MRRIAILFASLAALGAADEALVTVSIPDLAATRARFPQTLYGSAVMSPGLAGLRGWLEQESAKLGPPEDGVNPITLLQATAGVELVVLPPGKPRGEPGVIVHLRGATVADLVQGGLKLPEAGDGPIRGPACKRSPQGLLIGGNVAALAAPAVPKTTSDLVATWNVPAIVAAARAAIPPEQKAVADLVADLLPEGRIELSLTDDGARERCLLARKPAGLMPVDLALLNRLPADAATVYALGLDGDAFWKAHGAAILAAAASGMGGDPAQLRQQADQMLAGFGIQGGLDGLFAQLRGTVAAVVGPPRGLLPGLLIALPRSPVIDQLASFGLGLSGNAIPDEGKLLFVTLPRLGGMPQPMMAGGVAIARDKTQWWIASDSILLADLLAGKVGSWTGSAIGKRVLAEAGTAPCLIGGSDSRSVLAMLIPFAAIGGSMIEDNRFGAAITQAAHDLVLRCQADVVCAKEGPEGFVIEAHGPLAGLALPGLGSTAIIAAIAIPNLLESRVTANENAAASSLKSGIFPAQVQFQAGCYTDLDGDNRGEYGFLQGLSGAEAPVKSQLEAGRLTLLGMEFGHGLPINGYNFIIYLPISETEMADYATWKAKAEAGELTPEAINAAEKYFVAYAWPEVFDDTGRRTYALTQDGRVLTTTPLPIEGAPAWNALADGREGKVAEVLRNPTWLPYAK